MLKENKIIKHKHLIFQVNIKNPNIDVINKTSGPKKFHQNDNIDTLYQYSNARAKQYANSIGADYFCLTHSNFLGANVGPAYHKFYIYKLFELGYEKIFWIDSDAIFTKLCPNVFNVWDGVCAVREYRNANNSNKRIGLNQNWPYFISGAMMFDTNFYLKTKDHWQDVFKQHINNKYSKWDQGMFNILVCKHIGSYTDMGPNWGTWEKVGKYIRHYAGYTKKRWKKHEFEQWEGKIVKKASKIAVNLT